MYIIYNKHTHTLYITFSVHTLYCYPNNPGRSASIFIPNIAVEVLKLRVARRHTQTRTHFLGKQFLNSLPFQLLIKA